MIPSFPDFQIHKLLNNQNDLRHPNYQNVHEENYKTTPRATPILPFTHTHTHARTHTRRYHDENTSLL